MLQLGVRAHDFDYHDPLSLFTAVRDAGWQTVQLACPKSFKWPYPLSGEQLDLIRDAMEKTGVTISVLGCYVDAAVKDKEAREAAVKRYIAGLETGKALNVCCVGTETTKFSGSEEERGAHYQYLLDATLRMAEAAEKIGVDMGIEPVFEHTLNTPQLALQLKEQVNSDRIRWIWDAVNLTDPALQDQQDIQKRTIELLSQDIVAMHIKDCSFIQTGVKENVPLFTGDTDWRLPFAWAKEKKDMVLLREHAIESRSALELGEMKARLGL